MGTMQKIEDLVLSALQANKRARQDDFILYGAVLKRMGVDLKNTSLYDFLATAKRNKMPSLEGVPRARRKLCETHKELIDEETQYFRGQEEENYIKYSREK